MHVCSFNKREAVHLDMENQSRTSFDLQIQGSDSINKTLGV
jgi:hypothetical protein